MVMKRERKAEKDAHEKGGKGGEVEVWSNARNNKKRLGATLICNPDT